MIDNTQTDPKSSIVASDQLNLNISFEQNQPTSSETKVKIKKIVRIKRKRNDLPLEGLLVEEEFEKKKALKPSGPTRFRLVNTLELNAFPDIPSVVVEDKSKDNNGVCPKDNSQPLVHAAFFQEFKKSKLSKIHKSSSISSLGEKEFIAKVQNERRSATSQHLQAQRKAARYRIVSKSRVLPESSEEDIEDLPKKGKSKKRPIELYDAVIESSEPEEELSEVESTDITINLQRLFKENLILDAEKYAAAEEDYVYDVYEIDDSPTENLSSSGVLSWLRFSESDNEKIEEMGVYSESESEDDEDSNAEDHYANDYPEEFDSDSGKEYNNYAYDSEYDSDNGYSQGYSNQKNPEGFYCDEEDYC